MKQMKDSGIEWIGKMPENWALNRLLWCIEEVKEKNNPIQTTNVLSLTNKLGVIPYEEKGNQGNKAKEDYSEYGLAFENTLVINSMNVLIGSVGISDYFGCVSPVYYVFRNTPNSDLRFINYIFQTIPFQKELRNYANGILEIRLRISAHDMLRRMIPYPTLSEQQAISDYLDRQCAYIDNVIEKTHSSIEDYKKLRQAVITQAVTKGVRGDRPMKNSEIEWIGEIPKDWETTKLGRISSLRSGITLGRKIPDDAKMIERPYLRVANVQNGYVDISSVTTLEVTEEEDGKYRLHKDDVLMTEGGDRDKLGRGCVWNGEIEPCLHQNHIFALRTDPKYLNQNYFAYITTSQIGRVYFDITAIKTTNLACTSSSKVMAFVFPLPSIDEQHEIVAYLDQKCAEINSLITKKERFLIELDNYKKEKRTTIIVLCPNGMVEIID